jgi:hypothetical protein
MTKAAVTRVVCAVSAALAFPMTVLSAQECLGGLAVSNMGHAVGGTMAGAGAQRMSVAAYERLGSRLQLGAQAGVSGTSFGSTDARLVGASASWRPGAAAETGLRACPYVQAAWQDGPDNSGFNLRQLQGAAGVSMGRALSAGSLTLVPFARLGVLYLRNTSGFAGQRATFSRSVGETGVGLGLRFGQQFMLTPAVSRPFAAGSQPGAPEPTYSLSLRFGFGR